MPPRARPLALALAALAAGLPTTGAGAESPVFEPQGEFRERFQERVPVSGRTLVGLARLPGANEETPRGLGALRLFAAEREQFVCVRAVSRDARYSAEITYKLRGEPSGWARVAWPTAHDGFLRQKGPREVAVLASPGPCGGAPPLGGQTLLARFGGPGGGLIVLVNTRGAAMSAVLRAAVGGEEPRRPTRVRCSRVEAAGGTRLTAFDAECPLGPVAAGMHELILEMSAIGGGGAEIVERVLVVVPPP